jgi:hypothetical protein
MRRPKTRAVVCLLAVLLIACVMPCQAAQANKRSKRLWLASVAAVVAANALDLMSSRGGMEANPLLQNRNGSFNMRRGVGVKAAFSGGMLVSELLFARRTGGQTRSFAITNFGTAAALTGVAVRNWRVKNGELQLAGER